MDIRNSARGGWSYKALAGALVVGLASAITGCGPSTQEPASGVKVVAEESVTSPRPDTSAKTPASPAAPSAAPVAAASSPTMPERFSAPAGTQAPQAGTPAAKLAGDETAKPAEPNKEAPMPITAAGTTPKYLDDVPLIPRRVLFGNPDKAMARMSHDGKRLAYIAPVDDPAKAKPVTKDTVRGIRSYFWAYTNEHILYTQDTGGDEDWHVYRVDLASGDIKDMTPLKKVTAQIEAVSYKFPNEILIGLNDRDPRYHDVYRLDIRTGERKLVEENKQEFMGYVTDEDYRIRFAMRSSEDGGREIFEADGKGDWKPFMKVSLEDEMTTSIFGFDKTGDIAYLADSRGRDTSALKQLDLKTGKEKMIAENDKADVGGILAHPTDNTLLAVSFTYDRTQWQILDDSVRADFDYLKKVDDGEMQIAGQTLDNEHWIVGYLRDDGPVKYFRYDRKPERKATFLFTNRKALEGQPLVRMHSVVIKARDGLDLVSYLSLPKGTDPDGDGKPSEPLPLVLNVHGGPWARDDWGYDPEAQLLTNRGYASLSVNFRGSTGFGKKFGNAGNREWAGKMHDDLVDAVQWAVDNKIADPKRVAIMGGSYGGYATLVGLTVTPDLFACGIDIVGPSNILTLLSTIPPYWESGKQMFKDRVGDFTSEEGKKFLLERSPLTHVSQIKRPLLIGQGANDPRVKKSEADQIVKAMQDSKIPVTYVLFPDEGHGFARPPNRLAFNAVTEAFLAQNLAGRYEPIGKAFAGSTIEVPAGADDVPGLATALKSHQPPKEKAE